ncbi:MAG: ACT domain-containing protein [Actinomycetes bacterium]
MATDLTVHLDDQPGELGRLGALLGRSGVNIEGLCAVTSGGGKAEVHVLVHDLAGAFTALAGSGIDIAGEQEVAVLTVEDRPGVLGEVSRTLGAANVNITLAYLATNTRLVLAADDLAGALAALGQVEEGQGRSSTP